MDVSTYIFMTRWFRAEDAPKYWISELADRMIRHVQHHRPGSDEAPLGDDYTIRLNGVFIDHYLLRGDVECLRDDDRAIITREARDDWVRYYVSGPSRSFVADWGRSANLPSEIVDMITNGEKGISGPLTIIDDSGWYVHPGTRQMKEDFGQGNVYFYKCADIYHRDPAQYRALLNEQGIEVIYPDVYDINEVGVFLADESYERCCVRGLRVGSKLTLFVKMWRDRQKDEVTDQERCVIAATDEAAFIFSKLLLK